MLKQDLLMEFPDRAALDKYLVNEPYGTEVVNMNYNRGRLFLRMFAEAAAFFAL